MVFSKSVILLYNLENMNMVNNFYQESDLINSLKCKKRIAPTLVKGIDSLASLAEGSLVFGIGVYYGDSYD